MFPDSPVGSATGTSPGPTLTDELGAGPLALARVQRAQTARLLVETTAMTFTDIAFAAGFGVCASSTTPFVSVFATSPSALRTVAHSSGSKAASGAPTDQRPVGVSVRLPLRQPFDAAGVMAFIGERAIPGVESWDGTTYRRVLDLPDGGGIVTLTAHPDHVAARFDLDTWSDLAAAVQRIRRLLDLDSDPVAVDAALGSDPVLAGLVHRTPGRRAPASVDPFETAVRAVIGQQVSVAGARTVAGRIVEAVGRPVTADDDATLRQVPTPGATRDRARRGICDADGASRHDQAAVAGRHRRQRRTARRSGPGTNS